MEHTNQLAGEKSPYLLQHQHNPVDWLPWGEAAFERAKAEDKPIFLSVGYSTCHWCHVMERESFENESVAAIMNEHFINIKVDREERPDVDRVYMTFIQATTGQGGWPMSVFLTPDLKPFYGGTYFPPDNRWGRPGFATILGRLADAWRNDREGITGRSDEVTEALQRYSELDGSLKEVPWESIADQCFQHFAGTYDPKYGGFGEAPKFPRPVQHDFLHRYFHVKGEQRAFAMSEHTLGAMCDGGMNDQLGGGFHRYSVDERWIVSHFEKMLYDQAQLVVSYLEMFQMTRDEYFALAARATLEYVLRDMTHGDGGFYSAEDADSLSHEGAAHKEEGAFYVWTQAEIEAILGAEDAAIFNEFFGVKPKGNAPAGGDPHGEFKGKNILYRARSLSDVAAQFGRSHEEVAALLEECGRKLFAAREGRPRPHLDDKIITAWNGLMIGAFARAATVLDEPRYLEAATRAAAFVKRELFDAERGTLRRHFREGATEVAGFADDYAFLTRGLLDLFEASFDIEHLLWAETLTETLNREFLDEENGGYFNAAPDPRVLLRMKEDYDGAEPSANSLAAMNLLRLAHLLDRDDLGEQAKKTLRAFGTRVGQIPAAMPGLLCAALYAAAPPQHIVIAGEPNAEDTKALLRAARAPFLPHATIVLVDGGAGQARLAERLPFVAGMGKIEGKAAAYVCRDFACRQPVTNVEELTGLLRQ